MRRTLSEAQVDFFRRTGYLRLPKIVEPDVVDSLKEIVLRELRSNVDVRLDDKGTPYRVDNILYRAPSARSVFMDGPLIDALTSLLGPNIELVLNRHNHATINTRGNAMTRLHRDVLQWSRTIVTVVLYLDAADGDSGATQIIPSSHFLRFVGTPNNGGTWMDEHHVYADLLTQAVPVPVSAGDALVFDSTMFHATGENKSDSLRPCITVGYHSVDELAGDEYGASRVVVSGSRIYRGNDYRALGRDDNVLT